MISVLNLKAGDSILAWMKLGFALKKGRRPDGVLFRYVPSRPDRFDKDDLQQGIGSVISNDTTNYILRINIQRMNRMLAPVSQDDPQLVAEIHYKAFARIRLISPHAFAPKPEYPLRPTRQGLGTQFYAYRTQEEVQLVW